MTRLLARVGVLAGLLMIVAGAGLAVLLSETRSTSMAGGLLVALLVFGALVAVLWKIRGSLDATSDQPVPWASEDAFATPAPERSDDTYPLSSEHLARGIQTAGEQARSEGTVEDGLTVVRSALQETLLEAMERGNWERAAARRAIESGEWTDDPVAASVLDPDAATPDLSLRERVNAWLFPERVVRRRIQRAVQAIAEVGEETLPTVPGQTAPRTVPVVKPRLEELQRGADGNLQQAVDSDVTTRGPQPPEPDTDIHPTQSDGEVPDA